MSKGLATINSIIRTESNVNRIAQLAIDGAFKAADPKMHDAICTYLQTEGPIIDSGKMSVDGPEYVASRVRAETAQATLNFARDVYENAMHLDGPEYHRPPIRSTPKTRVQQLLEQHKSDTTGSTNISSIQPPSQAPAQTDTLDRSADSFAGYHDMMDVDNDYSKLSKDDGGNLQSGDELSEKQDEDEDDEDMAEGSQDEILDGGSEVEAEYGDSKKQGKDPTGEKQNWKKLYEAHSKRGGNVENALDGKQGGKQGRKKVRKDIKQNGIEQAQNGSHNVGTQTDDTEAGKEGAQPYDKSQGEVGEPEVPDGGGEANGQAEGGVGQEQNDVKGDEDTHEPAREEVNGRTCGEGGDDLD